LVKWRNLRMRR